MTLTTRLSMFFLSMLAFVLIGFSAALYVLADRYLHQQNAERLDTVLNTICGAIESGPEGVEWEPMDRQQNLDFSTFEDRVVWFVADQQGRVVAQSQGVNMDDFIKETSHAFPRQQTESRSRRWMVGTWKAGQKWITSERHQTESSGSQSKNENLKYRALSVTAGVSVLPMQTALRRLASTLAGLSATVWIIALVVGRSVCRRALLPVRRMAVAAGEIHAEDLTQRLPALESRDELDELSGAFNKMMDRLQQAFERQRRFTGDASHQLRTPLTAILGQVEVALRRERSGTEYRQVLETVRQRAAHLSRTVESLLFLARANAEADVPAIDPCDLTAWLPVHLKTWSAHSRAGDFAIKNTDSELCPIATQPALLGELLDILLDNACKYSELGTPITILAEKSGNEIRLEVEDRGYGLEEQELDGLFEPFCRSPEARRRGIDGVGLGLSIAKRLSEVLGGDLAVVSRPNQGSCFTLRFPMAALNRPGEPQLSSSPHA